LFLGGVGLMEDFVKSGNPIKDAATLNESRLSLVNGSMSNRGKARGKDFGQELEADINEGNGPELRYLISPNHFGNEREDVVVEPLKGKKSSSEGFQEKEKLSTNQGPKVLVEEHRDTIRSRGSVRLGGNNSLFQLEQRDRRNQGVIRGSINLRC
jgi:hypothetical protein